MPVTGNAVGLEVVGGLGKQDVGLGLAASTRHAGLAIGNQIAQVHAARLHQRQETELDGGRVATRVGHQASLAYGIAIDLGQAINSFGRQFRSSMGHAIPLLPRRHVLDAKVGGKVDHADATIEKGSRLLHGNAIRRREEHDIATGQGLLNFFLRGMSSGAVLESEALETGLTLSEFEGRSFAKIIATRTATTSH